ncbi:hypothetical protein LEP1GSC186_4200 [Leptospira noguchii serovar Autumnalis str. ZUN142]|uniref:Uncharacterized protein n=1 Tax=Leptospira noguchii serovar Autumnalis str. ZUN142 TaxID=1085540 RepID=M6UHC4_9LEPT|nr:hypothetical protein LEP1GSC186_4200 [Leptospira noguchii serovar Autumnalis str. ZUN142]
MPKKGLAPSQSRVVLDWVPGRLELASAHRVLRSRFSLFRKAQNAFKFSLRVHVYIVKIIFAEEGTRPFTVSRRARLGSGASFSRAHPSMDLHRVFSFLTETQNALARKLRVHVYIVKIIFAEEGTRRFANRRRGDLSSTTSRTCLSTSCASVAFFAF